MRSMSARLPQDALSTFLSAFLAVALATVALTAPTPTVEGTPVPPTAAAQGRDLSTVLVASTRPIADDAPSGSEARSGTVDAIVDGARNDTTDDTTVDTTDGTTNDTSDGTSTQPDHYGEDFWTYVQRVRPVVSRPETAVVTYFSTVGLAPALAGCLKLWGVDSARVLGHGGVAWNTVQPNETAAFDRALFACRVQHPFREDVG